MPINKMGGGMIMAGLVPFNKRNVSLINNGFGDFYNMLDDFFSDGWTPRRSLQQDTFKIDVQESEKEYVIEAELPGVKKDEVNIELNEGRLEIAVNREEVVSDEKKNYIHRERRYCSMSRGVYLADADKEGVKAKLDNGVLRISVPKQEKADRLISIDIE